MVFVYYAYCIWALTTEHYSIHLTIDVKLCGWGQQIEVLELIILEGRVFFIFRRKIYGPDTSEMDSKVLIPAPTQ